MSNIITNEWISSIDAIQGSDLVLYELIKRCGFLIKKSEEVQAEYLKLMRATAESEEIQTNAKINAQIKINALKNEILLLQGSISEVVNKISAVSPIIDNLLIDYSEE